MQGKTLEQLAEHVGGKVVGDGSVEISAVSTLDQAGPGDISFMTNMKYIGRARTTKAGAVIAGSEIETDAALLVADDPYYALMQIVVQLHGHRRHKKTGISEKASVAETAQIDDSCNIHDFVTVSDNARIGSGCVIYPGVFVGPDVKIGQRCILYPNVVGYDGTTIGDRVIIHANTTVGEDGYGFATKDGIHHKIPQVGCVMIEDDVEIGANCVIERGTLDETIIGRGCKIGDAVAIGHGAKIGPGCLLVPQVGIAGSTTLGHHCLIGGQVGVAGHIKIGNMVRIGAQSGVSNDIPDGASVFGSPAIDGSLGKRAYSLIRTLPEMRKKVRALQKWIEKHDTDLESE